MDKTAVVAIRMPAIQPFRLMRAASIFDCVMDELPTGRAILYRALTNLEEEQRERGQGIWDEGEAVMVSGRASGSCSNCSTRLLGGSGDTKGQEAAPRGVVDPVPLQPYSR